MELGILIAAAVLTATVASYYYVSAASKAMKSAGEKAQKVVDTLNNKTDVYIQKIANEI